MSAIIDAAAVPYLDGVRASLEAGYVPGGTQRNLAWTLPELDTSLDENTLLMLSDAQTSGGLLLAGELPGYPVVGELIPAADHSISIR